MPSPDATSPADTGYALFATAIGRCGIAWGRSGITAVQLPERTDDATARRLSRRSGTTAPAPPPADVQDVIDRIIALLEGERVDLSAARLDMAGVADVDRRVYEVARTIPPGHTLSYGDIANRLGDPVHGDPLLARAVGQALGRNPFAIVVPCHRVVGADGKLTGFSANGGLATKERMLVIEGARPEAPTLFDA
jgi:methylated-DNA-[protein]-cysteine S-methyltransferase